MIKPEAQILATVERAPDGVLFKIAAVGGDNLSTRDAIVGAMICLKRFCDQTGVELGTVMKDFFASSAITQFEPAEMLMKKPEGVN